MKAGGTVENNVNWSSIIRGLHSGQSFPEIARGCGIPPAIAKRAAELEAHCLSPEELSTFRGMGSGRGRIGGAMWSAKSGKEMLECSRNIANRRMGYLLAAVRQLNPQLAAEALLGPFESCYRDAVARGEIK